MSKKISRDDQNILEELLWNTRNRITDNSELLTSLEADILLGKEEKTPIIYSLIENYKYMVKEDTKKACALNNVLCVAGVKGYEFIEGRPTKMKFKGDIIITDPCYIIRDKAKGLTDNDWEACDYGQNMEALGIKNYLTADTIYGDWSCTTRDAKTDREIGHFCADAGLVSVFLLDEVLKYNPDFDYHTERDWTTTLIKDFDGEVSIEVVEVEDAETGNIFEEVSVIGKSKNGKKDFYTTQSGI